MRYRCFSLFYWYTLTQKRKAGNRLSFFMVFALLVFSIFVAVFLWVMAITDWWAPLFASQKRNFVTMTKCYDWYSQVLSFFLSSNTYFPFYLWTCYCRKRILKMNIQLSVVLRSHQHPEEVSLQQNQRLHGKTR